MATIGHWLGVQLANDKRLHVQLEQTGAMTLVITMGDGSQARADLPPLVGCTVTNFIRDYGKTTYVPEDD